MGRLGTGLRKLTKSPGVPQARHLAERSVAPYLRDDLHRLGVDHGLTVDRLAALELKVDAAMRHLADVSASVRAVEQHQPAILNAISSTSGTARALARETTALRERIEIASQQAVAASALHDLVAQLRLEHDGLAGWVRNDSERLTTLSESVSAGDESIREDVREHVKTIGWLLQRVETVRAEMMHELRYGRSADAPEVEARVINAPALETSDLRVNLGAGHIALEGYVNVDMRELPGIDVVAGVDALPFEPDSLTEIFSSHTIEHFPELELRRRLLPYWVSLLKPGGMFRAVVPDLEAMTKAFAEGSISFEQFRSVAYGGQEYEGDFHFNGFTPESLSSILLAAGLEHAEVIARARPNGDSLEFEVSAIKPGA